MPSIFDRRNNKVEAPVGEDEATLVPKAYNTPRPLTAAASVVDMGSKKEIDALTRRIQSDLWQKDAWSYYDLIGELKYSSNLVAKILSRINLYAAYIDDTARVPSPIRAVEELKDVKRETPSGNASSFVRDTENVLYKLESGSGGTSGTLFAIGVNLFVAGECYLVHEPARYSVNEPAKFQVHSVNEIIQNAKGNGLSIRTRRDAKVEDYIKLPQGGYICRIWNKHPNWSDEADSSVRGVLDLCDQLLLSDRDAANTAQSRLNGGLLFIPDALDNSAEPEVEMQEDDGMTPVPSQEMENSLEEELYRGMTEAVGNSSVASSYVPTIIRGEESLGEKIRYINFDKKYDPQMNERSSHLLDRILSGLDIPKDTAKGMSNVKYSNGVLIEEQLYKAHIEPMILLICDTLTVGFLRPALRSLGYDEEYVSRAAIWYDPSAITTKPSKSEASVVLYDKKILSAEAVLRHHGFAATDAPSKEELIQRVTLERGLMSEQMSNTFWSTLMPEGLEEKMRAQAQSFTDPAAAGALNQALGGAPAVSTPAPPPPPGLVEPTGSPAENPAAQALEEEPEPPLDTDVPDAG